MGHQFEDEDVLKGVDEKRRDFIKKVVIGTAFAVPVINSFSMDGLKVRLSNAEAERDATVAPGPGPGPGPRPAPGRPPVSPI